MDPMSSNTISSLSSAARQQGQAGQLDALQQRLKAGTGTSTGAETKDDDKLRQAAEDFEAVFLNQMFSEMFKGIKTDGPFGGGHGEEVFRGMLVNEYSKTVAKAGGIGVADAVYKELLKQQARGQ